MIEIIQLPNYKSLIKSDTQSELDKVKNYLSNEVEERIWDFKKKRWSNEKKRVTYSHYKIDKRFPNEITVPSGLAEIVDKYISSETDIEVINHSITPPRIQPIHKWINLFKANPKEENGKIQLEAYEKAISTNRGILSLFTGIGKTELLLSLAESFIDTFPNGNVAIITFANKVLDEIKIRANKYEVKLGDRIKLFNPVGYYRSNYSSTDEAKEWLSEVDLIIADEAHHFTSQDGCWASFVHDANPRYIYGFTASADVSSGEEINYLTPTTGSITSQIFSLMAYCGESLIHRDLPVPIHVTTIKTSITKKSDYSEFIENNPNSLHKLVSLFLLDKKTPQLLAEIINTHLPADVIVFIPEMTSIETGKYLADSLNSLGIPTVYLSAQIVCTPVGDIPSIDLNDLKDLAKKRAFRVLISNVVGIEGLDLPNLGAVIPITGASFKNFIQPLGRSARASEVHCIFIIDRNNHQLNRQMKNKYDTTIKRLNVLSNKTVTISI